MAPFGVCRAGQGASEGALMEWEIRPGMPQLERKWEQSPQRDPEAVVVPSNRESQQAWSTGGNLIGLQMQEGLGTSTEQAASGLEVPGQLLPQRVPLALQRRSGISMGEI